MFDATKAAPLWGVWKLEKQLGAGTFGDVYVARRSEMGREYTAAVKHISIPPKGITLQTLKADGLISDDASARRYCEDMLATLTREIDMCYELKGYTNFVNYEDHLILPRHGEVGFDIFIRMELLKSLPDYIAENGITIGGITKLCSDMCSALEVLGQKNLIHRDIKPANIFVNSTGDFKLGDFGVARHMEAMGSMSVKGTYNYMAPEVLKGGRVGPNSDLYSLALVLYRLLNYNRAPFLPPPPAQLGYQENQDALDRRLAGERLPAPARAELSLPLTNVIMRACEYEPARRFQTASEMKQALLDFRATEKQVYTTGPAELDHDATVAVERDFTPYRAPSAERQPVFQSPYTNKERSFSGSRSFHPVTVRKRRSPVLTIVLLIAGVAAVLIFAAVVMAMFDVGGGSAAAPAITQSTQTQAPKPARSPSPTPMPTMTPTPSPSPTPTPTPVPTPTPTPEPTPEPLPNWYECELTATASSTLAAQYGYSYYAGNVLSSTATSPWVEGASGYGVGEWIQISTSDGKQATLSEVSIRNGHQRTSDLYYKNGRVQDITLEFSDGSSVYVTLDDYMDWQTIVLSEPVSTSYVRIIIESVYSGSHYTDTCIARVYCG